jgi:hypothetical protein
MTGQLTTQEAKRQQVQQSSQHARDVETQEHHAKASASVRTHLSHPPLISKQGTIPVSIHPIFSLTSKQTTGTKPSSPISPPIPKSVSLANPLPNPGRSKPQPLRRPLRRLLLKIQKDNTHQRRRVK